MKNEVKKLAIAICVASMVIGSLVGLGISSKASDVKNDKSNKYVYSGIGMKEAVVAKDDKINEGYLGTVYKEVDVSSLEPLKAYDNKYYKISEESIGYILEKIGYDKKDVISYKTGRKNDIKAANMNKSCGIIRTQKAGNYNIKINAPYTYVQVLEINLITKEVNKVEDTTVIKDYSKNIRLNNSCVYLFDFEKKCKITSKDSFGNIQINKCKGKDYKVLTKTYDTSKVAISPNGDGIQDVAYPYIEVNSKLNNGIVNVLDARSRTIKQVRTLVENLSIDNMKRNGVAGVYKMSAYPFYIDSQNSIMWDGKVYNPETKRYERAKEGQYCIKIEEKGVDNTLTPVVSMPIKVDVTKPTIENFDVVISGGETIVYFKVKDRYDMSEYFTVNIQDKNDSKKNMEFKYRFMDTVETEKGAYMLNLGCIGDSKVDMVFTDCAGNSVSTDGKEL